VATDEAISFTQKRLPHSAILGSIRNDFILSLLNLFLYESLTESIDPESSTMP
jgi:hypothetical protein